MAKTGKRSTKKTVTSVRASSLRKRQNLAATIIIVLLVIFAVTALGTLIYTKLQERDVKAKAATFLLNPDDYVGNKNNGVRFAVCKRALKDTVTTGKYEVVGIVSRPSLLYFSSGGNHWALIESFQGVNPPFSTFSTGQNGSISWIPNGSTSYTYVRTLAKQSNAIVLNYQKIDVSKSSVSTVRLLVQFIPSC